MTDEEMAEEWLDERYLKDMGVRKPCKEAFLAGLKAGRETEREYVKNNAFTSMKEQGLFPFGKWHDLKKDPSDLPKHTCSVWTNIGPSYYDIENHCWMDEFGRTQSVVAWCEPKFEE